jgi:hypothetical protein
MTEVPMVGKRAGARRSLNQGVDDLLAAVPIPTPFDPSTFVQNVAAWRNRPIRLRPMPAELLKTLDDEGSDLPSGLAFEQDDLDTILYDGTTTGYHQAAIILHELWHLIAGHYAGVTLGGGARELLPSLGPRAVRDWSARHHYDDEEEREAEYFARRVLEVVTSRDGQGYELAGRLEETFEQ